VFLGRCEPRKGLHHALRAWQAAGVGERGGRFLIGGAFVPGYRELLGGLLDGPGVEYMGFIDDAPSLMRRADALVLPSVEEGSALVSYEAMASGCVPVVSTAVGARCENRISGLVHEPGDWQMLAAHLRELEADDAFRAELRDGAASRGAELTWRKAADVLSTCYGVGAAPTPR
jgi:glycosyltransferase involved in cell wall biosynthesis